MIMYQIDTDRSLGPRRWDSKRSSEYKRNPRWSSQVSFHMAHLKGDTNFHHWGFRFVFRWLFRVSSSQQRAVLPQRMSCRRKKRMKTRKSPCLGRSTVAHRMVNVLGFKSPFWLGQDEYDCTSSCIFCERDPLSHESTISFFLTICDLWIMFHKTWPFSFHTCVRSRVSKMFKFTTKIVFF